MEGHCFCLEESGELCDDCFNSWSGRFKCCEVDQYGRPVLDCGPGPQVEELSGSEDPDEPMDEDEADGYGEAEPRSQVESVSPVQSVSNAFRDAGQGADPYGEYLKRARISK